MAEDPIVLDLTGCRYGGEVHERIKEAFGFPDYYGKNWDAMWDCMDGLFDRREIVVRGFRTMPQEVQDYSRPLLEILEELHRENPEITHRME
ncbi:MAG: barstar family protein [Firmicutes bacterium]|nr:barstar family protein [Bacillota bacterium]